MRRPGNAGSNTATVHITVAKQALAQLLRHRRGSRPGRKALTRTAGPETATPSGPVCRSAVVLLDRLRGLPADTAELLTKTPTEV